MNLGVIGTSWISRSFVDAATESGKLKVTAVYSRSHAKGEEFASGCEDITIFTKMEDMAKSEAIDIVYIASPNSLHFEQTKLLLKHKKHVICEKPIFSTMEELREAYQLAEENGVFLFEAIRSIHSPNFHVLKEQIGKVGQIRSTMFQFIQYSSRYKLFLEGEEPNVFSPAFSGGALVDLGVYPLYVAVTLFGEPRKATYYPVLLRNGIDGSGTLILQYDGFVCTILCSKIAHSSLPSEIHGEEGTLIIDQIATMKEIEFVNQRLKRREKLEVDQLENDMVYEIEAFVQIIEENDIPAYELLKKLSCTVLEITEKVRHQARIVFKVENK